MAAEVSEGDADAVRVSATGTDYSNMFAAHDKDSALRLTNARHLAELLWRYHQPKSVVDVGCGLGFFLSACADRDAEVRGIDGPWVESMNRAIASEKYTIMDLENPLPTPDAKVDLVSCLEVAEHLSPDRGPGLVDDLCALSDHILFSAAIPGQRGQGHINCRWQGEWAQDFAARGYRCYDPFRGRLAGIENMSRWFIQNLLLFVREDVEVSAALEEHRIVPQAASRIDLWAHEQRIARRQRKLMKLRKDMRMALAQLESAGISPEFTPEGAERTS